MKNFNNLKSLILAVVISGFSVFTASAQCPTSISATDWGNGVFAFNSNGSGSTYLWDFGDGNTSTQQNVNQYQYNAPGSYLVCLTIDSCPPVCDSITVNYQCQPYSVYAQLDSNAAGTTFSAWGAGSVGNNYLWDFGDGNTSTLQNPNHYYANPGTYYYCLTVDSCPPVCDSVTVDYCNYSISNWGSFMNGYSFWMSSNGTNYLWDFGDGNTSTLQNPNHYYANPGTYYYCLTVDSCASVCDSIVVTNPCNVTANFTYTDNGNGNYTFTSISTGSNLAYYWDFGDGFQLWGNNVENHAYATNGSYNVNLFIQDSIAGCSDSIIQSINVTSVVCATVTAGFTATYNSNGAVTFVSTSTGVVMAETFDYGDNSTGSSFNHTYTSNGIYTVCLTATDLFAQCSDVFCDTVIITNAGTNSCNLIASFNYVDNGNGNYTFTNTSTGNASTYFWNFGDGNNSNIYSPNHTFVANGTFVVELIAIDSAGACVDYHLVTINVTGVAAPASCNAAFVAFPDSVSTGSVVVFNTSTGNNITYLWDFGDGNTSTQAYPFYTYTTAGPFLLCLTVDDGNGCVSTYCDSINSGGTVLKQSGFNINVQAPVVTGIENEIKTISELNIYPNPVQNKLTIDISLTEQAQVEVTIVDLLGNTVAIISNEGMNAGVTKLQWDASNIANGVYLLNVKTENSLTVKKLVVNK